MARYKTDKQKSFEHIEQAKKNYENILIVLEALCPFSKHYTDTFDPIKYGERVCARREKLGLNQNECGNSAGMSEAALSKIEQGNVKKLNRDHMYLLCAVLTVTPDYLLGLTEVQNEASQYGPYASDKMGRKILIDFYEPAIDLLEHLLSLNHMIAREKYSKYPELYTKLSDIVNCNDKPEATEALLLAVKHIHEEYKIEPYLGC